MKRQQLAEEMARHVYDWLIWRCDLSARVYGSWEALPEDLRQNKTRYMEIALEAVEELCGALPGIEDLAAIRPARDDALEGLEEGVAELRKRVDAWLPQKNKPA